MTTISTAKLIIKLEVLYDLVQTFRALAVDKQRQNALMSNGGKPWSQLCSCMDAIEDSVIAIEAYLKRRFSPSSGEMYLALYGLLQTLYVQQDAAANLAEVFELKVQLAPALKKVREIRNLSVGHPTKTDRGALIGSHFIDRNSLTKKRFSLRSFLADGTEPPSRPVSVVGLIDQQLDAIADSLKYTLSKIDG